MSGTSSSGSGSFLKAPCGEATTMGRGPHSSRNSTTWRLFLSASCWWVSWAQPSGENTRLGLWGWSTAVCPWCSSGVAELSGWLKCSSSKSSLTEGDYYSRKRGPGNTISRWLANWIYVRVTESKILLKKKKDTKHKKIWSLELKAQELPVAILKLTCWGQKHPTPRPTPRGHEERALASGLLPSSPFPSWAMLCPRMNLTLITPLL